MKKTLLSFFIGSSLFSQYCFAANNTYDDLIVKHSAELNLDANLVRSVIYRESAFNPNARSHKNAQGLMQVIPSTARMMGVNPAFLYDPEQNIIAGTRYLAYLSNKFNNDLVKVVAGYNAGHGAVEKYNGVPPFRETINYVNLVTQRYNQLSSQNNINKYDLNNVDINQMNAESLAAYANQSLNQNGAIPVQYNTDNNGKVTPINYRKRTEVFFISDAQNVKGGVKSSMIF